MSSTKTRRRGSLFSLFTAVLFTVVSTLILLNKQYIIDWVAFHQYQPTGEIEQIASRTSMNDQGKFYFYASKPKVDSTQQFNQECNRKEASSAILGCYTNNRIFLYGVSNEQLDGIKEVTAAHETLHAIYQRMGDDEKKDVNALLEAEYAKLADDKELATRMAYYAKNEAGERDNELHSILGTEFPNLDARLEAHYAKYFTNREAIVDLHESYASKFDALQADAESLTTQLKSLGAQIEKKSAAYNGDVKDLNTDIEAFNARASSGGFTDQTEFNRQRDALVTRARNLDGDRQQINSDSTEYETLRKKYNDTAASSNQLYNSIDSKLAPAPSV